MHPSIHCPAWACGVRLFARLKKLISGGICDPLKILMTPRPPWLYGYKVREHGKRFPSYSISQICPAISRIRFFIFFTSWKLCILALSLRQAKASSEDVPTEPRGYYHNVARFGRVKPLAGGARAVKLFPVPAIVANGPGYLEN